MGLVDGGGCNCEDGGGSQGLSQLPPSDLLRQAFDIARRTLVMGITASCCRTDLAGAPGGSTTAGSGELPPTPRNSLMPHQGELSEVDTIETSEAPSIAQLLGHAEQRAVPGGRSPPGAVSSARTAQS